MSKKTVIFLGGMIIVLGVVSVVFVARVWDPGWSPFRPEPEEVMKEALANLKDLKAFIIDLQIKSDFQGEEEIDFQGKFDAREDSADFQNLGAFVNFQTKFESQGMEFLLAGEWKAVGNHSYLKLTALPDLPLMDLFFQKMGIDLSETKNKWLELEPGFLGEGFEVLNRLRELITDENFYSVERELKDDEIGGERFYHYLISFDYSGVGDLIPSPEGQGSGRGEIWVRKDDLSFYKLEGETIINSAQIGEADGRIIKINFELSPLP